MRYDIESVLVVSNLHVVVKQACGCKNVGDHWSRETNPQTSRGIRLRSLLTVRKSADGIFFLNLMSIPPFGNMGTSFYCAFCFCVVEKKGKFNRKTNINKQLCGSAILTQ